MIQDIFFIENSLYVTTNFLIQCKLPESTIYNNISPNCPPEKKWHSISHPRDKKLRLVSIESIPKPLIKKYMIPLKDELFNFQRTIMFSDHAFKGRLSEDFIYRSLKWSYDLWRDYQENYDRELFDEERIENLCKTEALLTACSELLKYNRYKILDLFVIYNRFEDVVFKTESHQYFCNKLKRIRKGEPISRVIIHGLTKQPSNRKKLKEDVLVEIERLYCDPRKLNAQQILSAVNFYLIESNRKTISLSTVHRVLAQPHIKNRCAIGRHGVKYANEHILPHAYFSQPKTVGTIWAMDGSRLQFFHKTEEKLHNFLTFFVIMDCASKKIISYSVDETENSRMVMNAFEMACDKTGYLPTEIILDNSKAFKSNEMMELIAKIKLNNVYWHTIQPGNSRDNGAVERFFGVFQERICKEYSGYIGEGIKSSRLDGTPSTEEKRKGSVNKNIRTKEQLLQLLDELIRKYNNRKSYKEELSPEQKFNSLKVDKKVKQINRILNIQMFWAARILKVNHSAVIFYFNSNENIYNINNYDISTKINNTEVRIRYKPSDLSTIFVFDLNTDKYITKLNNVPRIPKAVSDRSEEEKIHLFKQAQKTKKMRTEAINQVELTKRLSEENREILPIELTEYGIGSKVEREKAETTFLSNELQCVINEVESKEVKPVDSFEEKFRNVFQSRGSLKILHHGKN